MRRPLALLAFAAVALVALAMWQRHRSAGAPACSWDTLERVDFAGGHITDRRRRAQPHTTLAVHVHSQDKLTTCNAGESDEDCKSRAANTFGPIPTPADSLQIVIEGTSQHVARATPSFTRDAPSNAHEQQTWVPDQPGAKPAAGSSFKASFDGAWVAGVLVGPSHDGSYLIDVWCSTESAPLPGTKTTR